MERPILAIKTGVQLAVAAFGAFTLLFLVVARGGGTVMDLVPLLLLVAIPTAALAEVGWRNLERFRSSG